MSSSTEAENELLALRPLKNIKVLDLTQIGAGPLGGMYLADLGADVVKVEPPSGDLGRQLGLPWVYEESAINIAFNRGKRSVGIDLKTVEGVEVLKNLAKQADVLLESFRPGVLAKFGLDFHSLQETNSRLIYCSISAYGQSGPFSEHAGVDGIIQATSGLMSLIGDENSDPCKVQAPIVDVGTGFIATIGILARLFERVSSGRGGYLDVNLFSSAVALQQSAITEYFGTGMLPQRMGSAAPYATPNEAFETADGWIMTAAYNGNRWAQLCRVLGVDELAKDDRFAALNERLINRQAMKEIIGPIFKTRSSAKWIADLKAADILCGKVSDYRDLAQNEQLEHMKLLTTTTDSLGREFVTPSFPINTRGLGKSRPAPSFSEHTTEVLTEAGYSKSEISAMYGSGALVRVKG